MLNKKEIVEKIREFMRSPKRLLFFDINGTSDIISLIFKIFVNDIKHPIKIGFLSTHQAHFSEVFSKSSSLIKTNTEYSVGEHKLKFYIYDKDSIKNAITDIDYLIVYPCENIKEKELVKLYNVNTYAFKIFFIVENSDDSFKHIKKLSPQILSLKESSNEKYWNIVKSTVSKSK